MGQIKPTQQRTLYRKELIRLIYCYTIIFPDGVADKSIILIAMSDHCACGLNASYRWSRAKRRVLLIAMVDWDCHCTVGTTVRLPFDAFEIVLVRYRAKAYVSIQKYPTNSTHACKPYLKIRNDFPQLSKCAHPQNNHSFKNLASIPSFRSTKTRKPPKEKKARFFKPATSKENSNNLANKNAFAKSSGSTALQPISVKNYINNNGFSERELEDFRESFALFDTEEVGSISAMELRNCLETLQGSSDQKMHHLDTLLQELSSCSEEDQLVFEDYVELMARTSLHHKIQEEESDDTANFSHVFQLFDEDQKGYITIQDLERVALDLGEYDITQEELEEMIERAQSSQQGRVYLPEFAKIMNLNLFHKLEQEAASYSVS
eukprot:scaffold1194_cov127-Cylindrotheca_fusiformis.AAC.10